MRICPDCGNTVNGRHNDICPARAEARKKPGYHPGMFRKQSAETYRKVDDSLRQVQMGGSRH